MTAPWSFQFPTVAPTQPGPFVPGPTGGDQLQQGAGDLGKVLMALRQLSQTSQIENRQLDVQQQLGMGNLGQQQAELQQKAGTEQYKRNQEAEALRRQAMAGKGLRQMLSARGVTGLDQVPDENVVGLVPELEKAGVIGPLTDAERRLTAYQKYDPNITPKVAKEFLGPTPGTTVNVDTKGQSAYATGRGGGAATRANKDLEDSRKSVEAFDRDERLIGYADEAITGVGANARLQAARVLRFLGNKEKFTNEVQATQLLKGEGARVVAEMITAGDAGRGNLNPQELAFLQQASGQDLSLDAGTIKELARIRYKIRIADEEARVAQLRQDAITYPDAAAANNADADRIEQQLRSRRATLAKLEKGAQVDDRKTVNEQRKKYGLPPLPEGTP